MITGTGKSRNMYDDYFATDETRTRLGTSFTRSREDRFSNLDQSSPENTSLHNSDGVLTFATGAFAPGVTVDKATYRMWAIDGGLKRNGLRSTGSTSFAGWTTSWPTVRFPDHPRLTTALSWWQPISSFPGR